MAIPNNYQFYILLKQTDDFSNWQQHFVIFYSSVGCNRYHFFSLQKRLTQNRVIKIIISISKFGYGIPGAVIAMGVLIPLAVDNALMTSCWCFGITSGLVLSGSIIAILFAYMEDFILGLGQIESSLRKSHPQWIWLLEYK